MTATSPPTWYEETEPVFLIDYLQFGNTLRFATVEPQIEIVRRGEVGGEELKFAAAVAAQQLGHAHEDLAAVLAALACRHTPAFMFRGRPTDSTAERSIYYTLVNYKGTLALPDVVQGAAARDIAQRCGFDELARVPLPERFHRLAVSWLLEGLSEYVVQVAAPRADAIKEPFLKLKHGGVAVSEARLFAADVPPDHIGIAIPGATPFKLVAIPASRLFVFDSIAQIDRVRVAINGLIALYLHRYYPTIWSRAGLQFEDVLDERLRKEMEVAVLIGRLDLARVVPRSET